MRKNNIHRSASQEEELPARIKLFTVTEEEATEEAIGSERLLSELQKFTEGGRRTNPWN